MCGFSFATVNYYVIFYLSPIVFSLTGNRSWIPFPIRAFFTAAKQKQQRENLDGNSNDSRVEIDSVRTGFIALVRLNLLPLKKTFKGFLLVLV